MCNNHNGYNLYRIITDGFYVVGNKVNIFNINYIRKIVL